MIDALLLMMESSPRRHRADESRQSAGMHHRRSRRPRRRAYRLGSKIVHGPRPRGSIRCGACPIALAERALGWSRKLPGTKVSIRTIALFPALCRGRFRAASGQAGNRSSPAGLGRSSRPGPRRVSVVMPVRDAGPISKLPAQHPRADLAGLRLCHPRRRLGRRLDRDPAPLGRARPRIRLFVGEESLGRLKRELGDAPDGSDLTCPHGCRRHRPSRPAAPPVGGVRFLSRRLPGRHLVRRIDANGRRVRPRDRWRLTRPGPFAPFPHGSIMVRRDAFERGGRLSQRMQLLGGCRSLFPPGWSGPHCSSCRDSLYLHRASGLSTRLVSPPGEVERAVDNFYRTMAGRARGRRRHRRNRKALALGIRFAGLAAALGGRLPAMLGQIWRRGALRLGY